MRRMISQKLQDFIAKLFGHIDQTENTTEVGGDLEVDGNIKVNGVENLTDKDGNPLDFGGGSASIVDTEEIVHIEGEEGTELYLAQAISNKVQNSLQLPQQAPLADALVGVGTNGAQKNIGVGDGLEIDNDVLKISFKTVYIDFQTQQTPEATISFINKLLNGYIWDIDNSGSNLVKPLINFSISDETNFSANVSNILINEDGSIESLQELNINCDSGVVSFDYIEV